MKTAHSTSAPSMTSSPVFIGGENRSGTTLLCVILDSHPALVCGPELDFLEPEDLGPHVLACCQMLAAADPRVRGTGVETADPRWQVGVQFVKQCHRFGVEPEELRKVVESQMAATGGMIDSFEERCLLIEALGELRRAGQGARRWGIKIQRLIAQGDGFARSWPEAQFVHIIRDGRDVAASHLRSGRPWAYRSVPEAAAGWLSVVDSVRYAVPPRQLFELRYEDLVADVASTVAPLLKFLRLPWDDAVLRHGELPHSLFDHPHGHPSATAVTNRVNASAVGRYRSHLSSDQRVEFERLAGGSLERLGYALE
jgi:hypothetical protein